MIVKRQNFNTFQAQELILQSGSGDEIEVNHYESSSKSAEDEDFAEDVPKISTVPKP